MEAERQRDRAPSPDRAQRDDLGVIGVAALGARERVEHVGLLAAVDLGCGRIVASEYKKRRMC